MELSAKAANVEDILAWRDRYRLEMNCQIIHDSIHTRPGWTHEYLLFAGEATVGYGSIAVGGPWKGKPTVYEWYVAPRYRTRMFDLFSALLTASGSAAIETQSNDTLLTVMLHAFASSVSSESILFHDKLTTVHAPPGAVFRSATTADALNVSPDQLKWHGVVEVEGEVVATGGVLFHYNRPYGDIYMEVLEPFRRRGLGSFLVERLKARGCAEVSVPRSREWDLREASAIEELLTKTRPTLRFPMTPERR